LLCQKLLSKEYRDGVYAKDVPLRGMALGLDWGVIVNPESPKFGQLVFEHDGCGCSNHVNQFGNQLGTSWILRKRTKRL
jgi:hypothetical protein